MTSLLLATFDLMPDGEPGGEALPAAFAAHGIEARWVRWDDPAVDWAAADAVGVRSAWDYHRRLPAFLAWAREVEAATTLLNGADVFAWNADKAYLLELADVVPTVPTDLLDDADLAGGLAKALDRWGSVVIKPRTGAGGVGLVVAESVADPRLEGLVAGPWIVQPVVDSVRTTGESSVYVFGGVAVAQVDKVAAAGEVRVHELYGGRSRPVALDPERATVAADAVRTAAQRRGADLVYARVDLMRWQDAWVVSELELIEPGLYLDVAPANADRFAAAVAGRLGRL
ncbi:ATP-grasp domain protein [Nocardioides ginsengisoli]|uniref:RimK family alpha-L-glutamate ligase n=1 Tax=Nocardioides ginsengisoli TaxID=363868 RepID=A0ABW3VV61_9ACTN